MIVFPVFKHVSYILLPRYLMLINKQFYSSWEADLKSRGVNIRLTTKLDRVISRDKKEVKVAIILKDGKAVIETYDEMVLCCLADSSLRILEKTATWTEKRVLGSVKFSDDVTVTH